MTFFVNAMANTKKTAMCLQISGFPSAVSLSGWSGYQTVAMVPALQHSKAWVESARRLCSLYSVSYNPPEGGKGGPCPFSKYRWGP